MLLTHPNGTLIANPDGNVTEDEDCCCPGTFLIGQYTPLCVFELHYESAMNDADTIENNWVTDSQILTLHRANGTNVDSPDCAIFNATGGASGGWDIFDWGNGPDLALDLIKGFGGDSITVVERVRNISTAASRLAWGTNGMFAGATFQATEPNMRITAITLPPGAVLTGGGVGDWGFSFETTGTVPSDGVVEVQFTVGPVEVNPLENTNVFTELITQNAAMDPLPTTIVLGPGPGPSDQHCWQYWRVVGSSESAGVAYPTIDPADAECDCICGPLNPQTTFPDLDCNCEGMAADLHGMRNGQNYEGSTNVPDMSSDWTINFSYVSSVLGNDTDLLWIGNRIGSPSPVPVIRVFRDAGGFIVARIDATDGAAGPPISLTVFINVAAWENFEENDFTLDWDSSSGELTFSVSNPVDGLTSNSNDWHPALSPVYETMNQVVLGRTYGSEPGSNLGCWKSYQLT